MQPGKDFLWQRIPAFRILLPFICGILLQWYFPLPFSISFASAVSALLLLIILQWFTLPTRFRLRFLPALLINILFLATGCIVLNTAFHRNSTNWFAKQPYQQLVAIITEPPVEKANSFRAVATIEYCIKDKRAVPASGKVILSFPKTWGVPSYGEEIIIHKKLSEIKNNSNPGGFNYKSYCEFNGISHQAYLTTKDFALTGNIESNAFYEKIFEWRSFILQVLRRHLSDPKIYGLAEALLIGYKDDLDKDLVKAYANTGVVHVIAISGLHLALVYGLLMLFTKQLSGKRWCWLRFIIVVSGLWVFSILAGAQPSILRASVMFTLIALRMIVNRNGSVYNSIAIAAFVLLAWNPFWLWDTGFQLSFLAVASIIVFYRKVYNLLCFQNKAIDLTWQLAAASIAAQILTIPVTLYYFHQFPFLFLITNIVAVPLSSLIVYVEIFLCVVSPIDWLAELTAKLLGMMIGFMNEFIERVNQIPFGNWTGLSLNFLQVLLLYCIIIAAAFALINRSKTAGYVMLISSLTFISLRSLDVYKARQQQQIIVYNVPKRKAIDLYNGRRTIYAGDNLKEAEFSHITPTRILRRSSSADIRKGKAFIFNGKSVVILDSTVKVLPNGRTIDILVFSGRRFMKLADISKNHIIKNVVIASDVPAGKASFIQKDCELLKISCYMVVDKGAFVMHLQ
jgi:competence protein ComEC